MGSQTPLYQWHKANNGKLIDFSGWDMPVNYGSQIEEHNAVRTTAGVFDVSHMTMIDIQGKGAKPYLQKLLANDIAKTDGILGKAIYTPMLNPEGGVMDDLIVYNLCGLNGSDDWYRAVVNCSTRRKDLDWMQEVASAYPVKIIEREDLAMIAVQGPEAIAKHSLANPVVADQIERLAAFQAAVIGEGLYARTGYTGEDGLEIILPADEILKLWENLVAAGVKACGLGARDTLRLEAGMNLYGNEMDDTVSPLAANMAWTIAWTPETRDFIGRAVLIQEKQNGAQYKLVGLMLRDKGVLRAHQRVVIAGVGDGVITSGTYSPTLNCSIALARVPVTAKIGFDCHVEIRNRQLEVDIVKPCFVRQGQSVV